MSEFFSKSLKNNFLDRERHLGIKIHPTTATGMPAQPSCVVSGALALTLHISRLAGLAPIHLVRVRNGWTVSFYPAVQIYGCLLLIVLNANIITGLYMDLQQDPENSIHVNNMTVKIAWIILLIVVGIIAAIGVLESPSRTKRMIDHLNLIDKIYASTNANVKKPDQTSSILAVAIVVAVIVQCTGDFYYATLATMYDDGELKIVYLYSCYYIEFLMTLLLELQFIFEAQLINFALKAVNDSLNDLIYVFDIQSLPKKSSLALDEFDCNIPSIPVNVMIDAINVTEKPNNQAQISKGAQDIVHRLILAYGAICDVVRQTNKSYGKVLLLLVGSFFLHLVIMPYFLVIYLLTSKGTPLNIFLEASYCVLLTAYLLVIVNPGHKMATEMDRTNMLVSQLLRRVSSPQDPLALELDLFCKQIDLNRVSYSALGVCTLTRPLIASIFGGVTTYLVIILQFQALDKQNTAA